VKILIELLEKYNLRKKSFTYVKNKGVDLNIMITTLKLIASCEILGLEIFFERNYFGHAFLETCQYVTMTRKFANT
jgi:hypothetical protein